MCAFEIDNIRFAYVGASVLCVPWIKMTTSEWFRLDYLRLVNILIAFCFYFEFPLMDQKHICFVLNGYL